MTERSSSGADDDVLDFVLELMGRLGSADLPWSVKQGRTHQGITNGQAILVADCYDAAGIVPELIVRAVNALPRIAAELAALRLSTGADGLKPPQRTHYGVWRYFEDRDEEIEVCGVCCPKHSLRPVRWPCPMALPARATAVQMHLRDLEQRGISLSWGDFVADLRYESQRGDPSTGWLRKTAAALADIIEQCLRSAPDLTPNQHP